MDIFDYPCQNSRVSRRGDTVTEIHDVTRCGAPRPENLVNVCLQRGPWREQHRRIDVSLHRNVRAQPLDCNLERGAVVYADHIRAAGSHCDQ